MHLRRALTAPRRLPGPPGLGAACGFAAIAALFLLLAWRFVLLQDGLPLIDWESAERLFEAQRWSQEPFFGNSRGWLPLYVILHGTVLRLFPGRLFTHVPLNIALSLGGLLAYWGLLGRINPGRRLENLVQVALGGLSLSFMENAVSVRADALFVCCVLSGMYFHLRRIDTESPLDQAAAVLFFAAAALTRYEGWAFALCLFGLGLGRPRPWLNLPVLLPIAAWMVFGDIRGQGPFFFLPDIQNTAHAVSAGLNTGRLEDFVTNVVLGIPVRPDMPMVVPLPLMALLAACGSVLLYRRGGAARHFLLLSWLPTAAMVYLAMAHDYPVLREHMAVFQLLFLACLAPLLDPLLGPLRMPAAAVAFTACASAAMSMGLHDQPRVYDSGPQGRRMSAMLQEFSRRRLAPDDAVLVETREFCPEREICEEPVMIRAFVHPRRVLLDRGDLTYLRAPGGRLLPEQPSLFDAPDREVRALLREAKVRVSVMRSPRLMSRLSPEWRSAGSWGDYQMLLRRGDRLAPGLAAHLSTLARTFPKEAAQR